jgi:repressor LexA
MVPFFTERQSRVLAFLREFQQSEGKAPTLVELARHLEVTKVTALQHLRALEKKGAIWRQRHAWRSIELLGPSAPATAPVTTMPQRGELRPGGLLHYGPSTGDDFDVRSIVPAEKHGHVVVVAGEDAATHDFRDGERLVIEPRGTPRDGELVMARVGAGDHVLFGRFRASPEGGAIEPLRAERSRPRPLSAVRVLGVVRASIRTFGC